MTDLSDRLTELEASDHEYILEQIALNNLEKDVIKSIDKLPPRCKEIFNLSRFELYSNTEISEKLNISVNTVKTHISKALESLRANLKKYLA